jgi:hypothetical protein
VHITNFNFDFTSEQALKENDFDEQLLTFKNNVSAGNYMSTQTEEIEARETTLKLTGLMNQISRMPLQQAKSVF